MPLVKPHTFPDRIEAFLSIPAHHPERDKVKENYAGPGKQRKLSSPPPTPEDLGQSDLNSAHFHSAHQVFTLGLSDVVNNSGVQAARPAGWIFFAGDKENKTVIGRLSHRAPSRMTAVYHDPRAWVLLKTSRDLEHLKPVSDGNYEPRVLTVPGLNLLVFWLLSLNPSLSDLVVPYPNQYIGALALPDGGFFDVARFFELIRPFALRRWRGTPWNVG